MVTGLNEGIEHENPVPIPEIPLIKENGMIGM